MKPDAIWGGLMALCVALVPNLLVFAVQSAQATSETGQKLWLIGLLGAGTACLAPIIFGRRGPCQRESMVRGLPARLMIAGVLASAYFIAVVGLKSGWQGLASSTAKTQGLGAGIAETIDSSLVPCLYVGFYYLFARRNARVAGNEPPRISRRACLGTSLVFAGLVSLSITMLTGHHYSWATHEWILIICAITGAVGTTFSILYLRCLVRVHKAELGFAIPCRYGGVAAVFIAWAVLMQGFAGLAILPSLIMFFGGGGLINLALYCSVKIESEHAQAAAVGLVPLFAVGLEFGLSIMGVHSKTPFGHPGIWIAALVAMFGIAILEKDPARGAIWGKAAQTKTFHLPQQS